MPEFTGERVIPELVDADLLNEHLARYRFARHFVRGLSSLTDILDAGCGSGYGTAELAETGAHVTGTDISAEAVEQARQRYDGARIRFLEAPCEALPFEAAAFDLVTAFEVIEHLDRWRELLTEAHRVLRPAGVLLVSTPNRDYYTESRGEAGPNPFHRHEFDHAEFRQALEAVFPHVRIWTQNHAEAIVFAPPAADGAALEVSGESDAASAHFYLAACSQSPIAAEGVFAWAPSTANVLRERERHIAKLTGELAQKDQWLRQTLDAHAELQRNHEEVIAELRRSNDWAAELNRGLTESNERVTALQKELDVRLTWVGDLESQIERARAHIAGLDTEIERLETVASERTLWAQRLDAEIAEYREELQRMGGSRWVQAGAKLGLGPRPRDGR